MIYGTFIYNLVEIASINDSDSLTQYCNETGMSPVEIARSFALAHAFKHLNDEQKEDVLFAVRCAMSLISHGKSDASVS